MDQEREDYADPEPPRRRRVPLWIIVVLVVLMAVLGPPCFIFNWWPY